MVFRNLCIFLLCNLPNLCSGQVDTSYIYNPSASFGILDLRIAKSTSQYYYLNEGETFSFRKSNGESTRTFLDMTAWDSKPYEEGNLRERIGSADNFVMNYRLLKPNTYDDKYANGYPLVILLHGLLERGNCAEGKCYHGGRGYSPGTNSPSAPTSRDSELLNNDYNLVHGGSNYLEARNRNGTRYPDDPMGASRAFPGFVVFPQNLNGWDDLAVEDAIRIVRLLVKKYNIDENRIYINGVSHGGHGAYKALTRAPWLFAAGVLFSAADDAGTIAQNQIEKIAGIPLWLFQGGKDLKPTQPQTERYVQQFRSKGASVRYTLYPELGHGTWNKAFAEPDFFSWMLRHRKNDIHVYADNPVICTTSKEGVTLSMPEGFAGYEWEHNGSIVGANSSLIANEPGDYRGRYQTKKFSGSKWNPWSGSVTVAIKDPGISKISSTGTRFLPDLNGADTIAFTASSSYDIYNWYKDNNSRLKLDDTVSVVTIRAVSGDGRYYLKAAAFDKCFTEASLPMQVYFGDRAPVSVNSPASLSAVSQSPSQAEIRWVDNSDNETGFEIWRRRRISAETFDVWKLAGIAEINSTKAIDDKLDPSSEYEYKIRAIADKGRSLYYPASGEPPATVTTAADNEIPSAPELINVRQIGLTTLSIDWRPSFDNSAIAQYVILRNGEPLMTNSTDTTAVVNVEVNTDYNFRVASIDVAGNQSAPSNEVIISTVVDGLFFQHSTGAWENLESIDWSLAEFTGRVPRLTLSPKTQQDFFNFRFEGFLRIINDGIYQFRISSDDGSSLAIGDSIFVANDGIHTMATTTSAINLMESGHHRIVVEFFDYDRSDSLLVEYKGPDSNNEWVSIPEEAFSSKVITETESVVDHEFVASIFPNPTTGDNINLSLPDTNSDAVVSVLTGTGQLIYSAELPSEEIEHGHRLQKFERLLPGIYFVTIRQRNFVKNIKLIIK